MFYVIFWSGYGLLVVPIALVGFALGFAVVPPTLGVFGVREPVSMWMGAGAGSLIAGLLVLWFCHIQEGRNAEPIYDEKTDTHFMLKTSAGSLFFISMRSWGWLLIVLSLFGPAQLLQFVM